MSRKKVTVVGGGFVGSTTAQRIVDMELADVVLTDILEGPPAGKALDMVESGPISGRIRLLRGFRRQTEITVPLQERCGGDHGGIPAEAGDEPRRPAEGELRRGKSGGGTDREALAEVHPCGGDESAGCDGAGGVSRERVPKNRVLGMAGVLDSARMSAFVAMECKVSVENVHSFVLGGHGDDMVPLPRYSTVAGIPLPDLLPKERIDAIVERTRKGGAEIVNLLKTGSAYYAPSAAAVEMVEAILKDKKKILPCAVYLEGEYGLRDCCGRAVKLARAGRKRLFRLS